MWWKQRLEQFFLPRKRIVDKKSLFHFFSKLDHVQSYINLGKNTKRSDKNGDIADKNALFCKTNPMILRCNTYEFAEEALRHQIT